MGTDYMNSKKGHIFIIAAVALLALILVSCGGPKRDDLGMEIPPDDKFSVAPSSDQCKFFDISVTYDDSFPLVYNEDLPLQKIYWHLSAKPKDGVKVKDVFCTLVLNEWIVSQSSSPFLLYMGLNPDLAMDMPVEVKGAHSEMEKFISKELAASEEYKKEIKAPLKFMISYNGLREYYFVTPEFKEYEAF